MSEPKPPALESQWIGDPNQASRRPAEPAKPKTAPAPPPPEPPGLGVPAQPAKKSQTVAAEDSVLLNRKVQMAEVAALEKELAVSEKGWDLSGLIQKSGLKSLVMLLAGLAALVVITQGVMLAGRIADLPFWGQWLAWAGLAGVCGLVVVSTVKFLRAYYRFERSPRLAVGALSALAERSHLRAQAHHQLNRAKATFQGLLAAYPVEGEKAAADLAGLGFKPGEISLLAQNRQRLLDQAAEAETSAWLQDLDRLFLRHLDKAARRRVVQYAWLTGLKSAILPTGFIDAAVVLLNSHRLLTDLCSIYRLRAGGIGAAAILFRVFVNTLAAGQMEKWLEQATAQVLDSAPDAGNEAAGFFLRILPGGILGRVAEGGANAFLVIRLGAAAIHHLRPMDELER